MSMIQSKNRRKEASKIQRILLAVILSNLVCLCSGFSKLLPTNSVNQFGIRYSQRQCYKNVILSESHKKSSPWQLYSPLSAHSFYSLLPFTKIQRTDNRKNYGVVCQMIYAPPSSGYQTPDEEELFLPETYEPTMEYPGTMRPGRTAENMPLHDLPIGDNDPDPIPWPHFQEIDWYHQWPSPHPHPIPMDEFIEMNGRWATLEDEAEMRRDARRGVRERREAAEKEKTSHQVMDDTDDDDDDDKDLGDGVADMLSAATGIDTDADAMTKKQRGAIDVDIEDTDDDDSQALMEDEDEDEDDDDDDEDDEDFLLELGLDLDDDDDDDETEDDDGIDDVTDDDDDDGDAPAYSSDDSSSDLLRAMQGLIDMDKIDDSEIDDDENDDGFDMNLDFNDDDDDNIVDEENNSEVKVVPIENLNDADELDDHDDITYDDDNEYDDGGFDLDIDDEFGGEIEGDDYGEDDDNEDSW